MIIQPVIAQWFLLSSRHRLGMMYKILKEAKNAKLSSYDFVEFNSSLLSFISNFGSIHFHEVR